MSDSVHYHREARRLAGLAEQVTTDQIRKTLLLQAEQCEAAASELEILAQREEIERLLG
jgi:hypothetical protein